MSKGYIIKEIPVIPEDCYQCDEINGESGYCRHVGKYVDHFVELGERYPTCPIQPVPERDT